MKTILVVEDDLNLSRGIAFNFTREGFIVHCADTLGAAKNIFGQQAVGLVILDLNLPDGDGVDFCRDVCKKSNVPVIMLTARDMEADEIAGFGAGADDYITKPFSVSVLRARVDAVLRRYENKEVIQSGAFKLDINSCKLFRGGEEIPISATEYRLLKILMGSANSVLSKEQISAALWDSQDGYVDDNTLSVNISRLRSKIEENPKTPQIIKTIHGIGYVWIGG